MVQDEFLTFTASYADVVLPASPSLEKDGTFTNTERRIQRINQALTPLGDSKPDWVIFQMIAKEFGFDWNYNYPGDIMDEIARLTPLYAGVSYDRLQGFDSLQWPVHEDGTDEPLLYLEGFNFENKKQNSILYHLITSLKKMKYMTYMLIMVVYLNISMKVI